MKKLVFVLAVLISFTVKAQLPEYGITGRIGAFTTITDNETEYGIGQQLMSGAWINLPLTPKTKLQLSLLQFGERQGAGEITFIDDSRSPLVDAVVTHYNLAVGLQAIYLYGFSDKWSAGIGAGAKYEYFSKSRVKADAENAYTNIKFKDSYNNLYRRDLTLQVPVELQYIITDRYTFVGQLQLQLSNRLGASETNFTERDLGAAIGINYRL